MTYRLVIIPEGATLPEDLNHLLYHASDVIDAIKAGHDADLVIVAVNTRELQMMAEYRDLFDLDVTAIIGLQGAMYNTVWNTYVATMERTTVDAIRAKLQESNDSRSAAGSAAVERPSKAIRLARANKALGEGEGAEPDESSFSDDSAA